jgi:LemA protein
VNPEVVVIGVVVLIGLGIVVSYNRFVAQRQSIDTTWSGVDVELQRRHDLIPNLVETVKGYAAHEQRVLETVTEARTRAVTADRDPDVGPAGQARVEGELTGALRTLFAVAENYPDLKASRAFRDLQAQLVETEDRIAAMRRLYNIEVMHHNRRIEAVPSNIVAWMFGLERRDLFELEQPSYALPPRV